MPDNRKPSTELRRQANDEDVRSLLQLWEVALLESGSQCHVSTKMDLKRVHLRVEHEGLSFLTITLPAFCKDLERALADGMVARHSFLGFKRNAELPRFLGGFLERVFDRSTGNLLERPCVDSIQAIRQLTLMFGKIGLDCSEERQAAAVAGYLECEKDVRRQDDQRSDADTLAFTRLSRLLWADVFAHVDLQVHRGALLPKHGPGATADRLRGNSKWRQAEWPRRLESIFPSGEYLIPNWRYHNDLDHIHILEPGDERPVRVIFVPKTLKTPRVIAIEPTAMQYMQQALLRALVGAIQSGEYSRYGWLLGFRDQTVNNRLARTGSRDGSLATLDLSEASDRVSNELVRQMLAPHPWLAEGVDACRSRSAHVPGEGVIRLAKFASMGSALTFPIEAIVFSTVIMVGIERARGHRLTHRDIQSLRGRVRVYGDDIIVPADYAVHVAQALEDFGLRVNMSKSFWTGKFRESCGKEYYDGTDVSIVRVRALLPTRRGDVPEVVAAVSLRNRLYMSGMWKTAAYMDGVLEGILGFYPTVEPHATGLGRWSLMGYETHRLHPKLHHPLVRGWTTQAKPPASSLDGSAALLKCLLSAEYATHDPVADFTNSISHWEDGGHTSTWLDEVDDARRDVIISMLQGVEPAPDTRHLERLGRPQRVDMKLRWFTPLSQRSTNWPAL